jgi:uncharacterized protein
VSSDLVWAGAPGTFRVEIAHVESSPGGLRARGTQIAVEDAAYELRYEVDAERLFVEMVGGGSLEVGLDGADFFDLASSPLFNSFPVIRHGMHRGGEPRDFVMAWVSVPELAVSRSEQRYDPLAGEGLVRFRTGSFTADIEFDSDGFVVHYPDLAERVYPEDR